jgi:hypothetical protein
MKTIIINFAVIQTRYVQFLWQTLGKETASSGKLKRASLYAYSFLDTKFSSIPMTESIAAATSANIKMSVNP